MKKLFYIFLFLLGSSLQAAHTVTFKNDFDKPISVGVTIKKEIPKKEEKYISFSLSEKNASHPVEIAWNECITKVSVKAQGDKRFYFAWPKQKGNVISSKEICDSGTMTLYQDQSDKYYYGRFRGK